MRLQPLICHPPLLPGESLPSLLARLAKLNDYEPRSLLSSIIRNFLNLPYATRLGFPSHSSLFDTLEALTTIAASELHRATAHHFTYLLTPPEKEIEYLELSLGGTYIPLLSKESARNRMRPEHASQFCPLCLQDGAYHRLIWLPFASAVCLQHKCLLVNSCPKCGGRIGIADIIEACCSRCRTNLTEIQQISVNEDSFGIFTQEVIQSWLVNDDKLISPIYSLPQQAPRILYRVIEGLRSVVMQLSQDWPQLHRIDIEQQVLQWLPCQQAETLTPNQSYCLDATAFKGLINWPSGFYEFLTAYCNRENKVEYRAHIPIQGVQDSFGNLYVRWLSKHWQHPSFEFIQEAFNRYLVDNHISFPTTKRLIRYKDTPQLTEDLHYMSSSEAAQTLETSRERLRALIGSGQLISYKPQDKSWIALVRREDVLKLRDEWTQVVEFKEVAEWLGLNKEVVLKLVQMGLLNARRTSRGSRRVFHRSDVIECLDRLFKGVKQLAYDNEVKENFLSLQSASRQLTKVGLDMASILQQVATGRLCAYLPENQKPQLRNLVFSRSDITKYLEPVNMEKGWIERKEVIRILGIKRDTLMKRIKAGLIAPVAIYGKTYYFDRQEVEKYQSVYVRLAEAVKILGVNKQTVPNLVQQGRLKAIRGPYVDGFQYYIFNREDLLQWRKERLTMKEVQLQLKVNRSAIVNWVRQGKLVPLEERTLKPWYFSRQDVLDGIPVRAR